MKTDNLLVKVLIVVLLTLLLLLIFEFFTRISVNASIPKNGQVVKQLADGWIRFENIGLARRVHNPNDQGGAGEVSPGAIAYLYQRRPGNIFIQVSAYNYFPDADVLDATVMAVGHMMTDKTSAQRLGLGGGSRFEGEWGIFSVFEVEASKKKTDEMPEMTLILAQRDSEGWSIAIQGMAEFTVLVQNSPDYFISSEAKSSLLGKASDE